MGWSVTINDLQSYEGFEDETLEIIGRENPAYCGDALAALEAARQLRLMTCTLAGGRTPSPYGDDEVVTVTVHGFPRHHVMNDAMLAVVRAGPDAA